MAINVADLVARLGLDVSQFKQGAAEAEQTAKGMGAILYDAAGKPLVKVSEAVTGVKKAAEEAAPSGKGLSDVFRGLGQQGVGLFGALSPLVHSLGGVGLGLGAAALAAKASITEFTTFTQRVRDLSFMSGGSAKDVSILVAGLEDLGVESETVQIAMARMSRAVSEGDPTLIRLGVSLRNASGAQKDGLTLFYETIDALGRVSNETERNAMTMDIFGRGWVNIMEVLRRGSGELRRLGEESNKVISPDDIKRVQEYNLAWRDLLNIWESLKIRAGETVVPFVTTILKRLSGQEATEAARKQAAGPFADLQETIPGPLGGPWPSGPSLADLKRALVGGQIGQYGAAVGMLQAGAVPPGMQRIQAEAAAAAELSRKTRDRELAELAIAEKNGDVTVQEAAKRRLQIRAKSAAEIAKVELDAELQSRQERIRLNQVEVKDRERLLDEYSILGSNAAKDDQGLNEYYLGVKFQEEEDFQKRVREAREEGFAFDDTANQMRVEDYRVTEGEIAVARDAGARRDRERMADDVKNYKDKLDEERRLQQASLEYRFLASQDYFTKVRYGLAIHVTDWRTADERILDITREFASAATRTLDDFFFNVLHGRFKGLSDLARQFGEQLLRIASQELARSTLSGLFGVGGILGMGGGGGGGAGLTALQAMQLSSMATGGPAGASGGGGAGPFTGGGILGPLASLYGLGTKAVTGGQALISGGPGAALEAILGLKAGTLFAAAPAEFGAYSSTAGLTAAELGTTGAEAAGGLAGLAPLGALALPLIPFLLMQMFGSGPSAAPPEAYAQRQEDMRKFLAGGGDILDFPNPELGFNSLGQARTQRQYDEFVRSQQGGSDSFSAATAAALATPLNQALLDAYFGPTSYSSPWQPDTGRQHGGPVWPGGTFTVGEAGPERLTLGRGGFGKVTPFYGRDNAGGGGVNVNITGPLTLIGAGGKEEFIRFVAGGLRDLRTRMGGADLFAGRT